MFLQINAAGVIHPINAPREFTVENNWQRPFIHAKHFYLPPVRGYSFMKNIIKISVSDGSSEVLAVATFTSSSGLCEDAIKRELLPRMHQCSPGEWVGKSIVFYASNKQKSSAWLLYLDVDQRSLHIVNIEFNDHVVTDRARLNHSRKFSLLYLHGDCSVENCADKAHIYIFDLLGNRMPANV